MKKLIVFLILMLAPSTLASGPPPLEIVESEDGGPQFIAKFNSYSYVCSYPPSPDYQPNWDDCADNTEIRFQTMEELRLQTNERQWNIILNCANSALVGLSDAIKPPNLVTWQLFLDQYEPSKELMDKIASSIKEGDNDNWRVRQRIVDQLSGDEYFLPLLKFKRSDDLTPQQELILDAAIGNRNLLRKNIRTLLLNDKTFLTDALEKADPELQELIHHRLSELEKIDKK